MEITLCVLIRNIRILFLLLLAGQSLAADIYVSAGPAGTIALSSSPNIPVSHRSFATAPFFDEYHGKGIGSRGLIEFGKYDYEELKRILPEHVFNALPKNKAGKVYLHIQPNGQPGLVSNDVQLKCHSWADPEGKYMPRAQPGGNEAVVGDVEFGMNLGFWGSLSNKCAGFHERNLLKNQDMFFPDVTSIDYSRSLISLDRQPWEISDGGSFKLVENTSPAPGPAVSITRTEENGATFYAFKTTQLPAKAIEGKPLALSFWVKSPRAGKLRTCLWTPEDNRIFGLTDYHITAANTWQRVVLSIPATHNIRGDNVHFYLAESLNGLLGYLNDDIEFAGVKLEVGKGANFIPGHWYMWGGGHGELVVRDDIPDVGRGTAMRFVQDKTPETTFYSVNQNLPKSAFKKIQGRSVTVSGFIRSNRTGQFNTLMRAEPTGVESKRAIHHVVGDEQWHPFNYTFTPADHHGLEGDYIAFYLCEGLHGLIQEKDDWIEFAGVQLELGDKRTECQLLTLGEMVANQGCLVRSKQTIHDQGLLSPTSLSVVPCGYKGLKLLDGINRFTGISVVELLPGHGVRADKTGEMAITFHIVCPVELLAIFGEQDNPRNLVSHTLKLFGEGKRKRELLDLGIDKKRGCRPQHQPVEMTFAEFATVLKQAGMMDCHLSRLLETKTGRGQRAGVVPAGAAMANPLVVYPVLPPPVVQQPAVQQPDQAAVVVRLKYMVGFMIGNMPNKPANTDGILDVMFAKVDGKVLQQASKNKEFFKNKVRVFLELHKKYPRLFTADKFDVFAAGVDDELAQGLVSRTKEYDYENMKAICDVMGVAVPPDVAAPKVVVPVHQPVRVHQPKPAPAQVNLPAPVVVAPPPPASIRDYRGQSVAIRIFNDLNNPERRLQGDQLGQALTVVERNRVARQDMVLMGEPAVSIDKLCQGYRKLPKHHYPETLDSLYDISHVITMPTGPVKTEAQRAKVAQADKLKERYLLQPVRGGGDCLYLSYFTGWIHALLEDVITRRNPNAIRQQIERLRTVDPNYRHFTQCYRVDGDCDELITLLERLTANPTLNELHKLIMPTETVRGVVRGGGQEALWGGKGKIITPIIRYFRTHTIYLLREDLMKEVYFNPDVRVQEQRWKELLERMEFLVEFFGCKAAVNNVRTKSHQPDMHVLDAFLLSQMESGADATGLEIAMLNTIRPLSLCYGAGHREETQACKATGGFRVGGGVYAEGQRIVIFQRDNHYDALIPLDLCYVTKRYHQQLVGQYRPMPNYRGNRHFGARRIFVPPQGVPHVQGQPPQPVQQKVAGPFQPAGKVTPQVVQHNLQPAAQPRVVQLRTDEFVDKLEPEHARIIQHYTGRYKKAASGHYTGDLQHVLPWELNCDNPQAGKKIKVYKKIGQGGQGAIYSASIDGLDQPDMAFKVSDFYDDADPMACIAFNKSACQHPLISKDMLWMVKRSWDQYRPSKFYQLMEKNPKDLWGVVSDPDRPVQWFNKQPYRRLDRKLAMTLIYQMVQAVAHMHWHGWAHRDIKLGNTMIGPDCTGIRLIDFGMSQNVGTDAGAAAQKGHQTQKGTPGYMIFVEGEQGYNVFAADMAALAVCYFGMRVGLNKPLIDIPPEIKAKLPNNYFRQVIAAYNDLIKKNGDDARHEISTTIQLKLVGAGLADDGDTTQLQHEAEFLKQLLDPIRHKDADSASLARILRSDALMKEARGLKLVD